MHAARCVAPAGPPQTPSEDADRTLAVLTYHKIHPSGEFGINTVSPGRLGRHLDTLRSHGFAHVDLAGLRQGLEGAELLPRRTCHLTFDDAYANVAEHAMPVCEKHGVRPTVFVISGVVGKTSRWDLSVPRRRHMGWDELRRLAEDGVAIGAHTVSHPFLTRLDPPRARAEIEGSRKRIEDGVGVSVTTFAYPYGAHAPWLEEIVAASGFEMAFTMDPSRAATWEGRLALPRIGVYAIDGPRSVTAKVGCRGPNASRRAHRLNRWIRLCAYGNLIARG